MNKKSFYFGTLLLAALALGSCANDDTATDKTAGKDTPKTGTVFSSETEPATRTSAKYTGSGLDFYWTASDKIWVKDDNGNYNQSASDDISSRIAAVPGSTTTDKAKFWVNGSYTGSTHKVRYTGKNGTKDKVTIKASQTQNTPNDAAHIADDGDFGVADATGSGKYSFTLNHKAAYVTFMPYTAQDVIAGAKLQKIRIYTDNTSDQLAGTFDVDDAGTLSNATSTSNSVELDVRGGDWEGGFVIPKSYFPNYTTNAATIVVKPGTYSNINVEYTLRDPASYIIGTITKSYTNVTFEAGKNTPIRMNLKVKEYPGNDYYMWGAYQNYWAGFEWNNPILSKRTQPVLAGRQNTTDAPPSWGTWISPHTPRDFNDVMGYTDVTGSSPAITPQATAIGSPNVNEWLWYLKKGDPHYDQTTLWASMGHLYSGGMWILKKSKIPNFSSNHAPDETTDYTRTTTIVSYNSQDEGKTIPQGKPSNLSNYFYLPCFGQYWAGKLDNIGFMCGYWSSTVVPDDTYRTYAVMLYNNSVELKNLTGRNNGFKYLKISNEDEYRPF